MTSKRVRWIALAAGVLGAGCALWTLLPLPPAADVYAARRWGVGAGYIGFIFGLPLSVVGVPVAVLLHPFPVGDDTSGAAVVAAMITGIVGVNWAFWVVGVAALIGAFRERRGRAAVAGSRPPV